MPSVGTPKSAEQTQHDWDTNPRWKDVTRTYTAEDAVALSTTRCQRADQIAKIEADTSVKNWLVPIVADGEAGFGGALNVFELQKALIAPGVAGSHWEDQLASEKKSATWAARC